MSPVLVDVPVITLSLVGASEPQSVQVAITGLTPGQSLVVTKQAGATVWGVRGGRQMLTTTSVILTDPATPLNVPLTYTVTLEGEGFTAGPITVPYMAGRYVLQSPDGRTVVPFVRWYDEGDPRDLALRAVTFRIPGRSRPVARYDVAAGESGQMTIRTVRTATDALINHLRTVGPVLLLRTDGALRDLTAVEYLLITRAPRRLWSGAGGLSVDRVWSLSFEVIDDPDVDTILPTATWSDFDAAYAGATWDDFDTEWATLTWADFDRTDWTQYA